MSIAAPANKSALVFAYNADSGVMNALLDIAHKIASPQTYSCNLCAITHATFSMRDEWKRFIATLGVPVEFLHRDELAERYGVRGVALPAIFRKTDGGLEPWIDREAINHCQSLDDLKQLVEQKKKIRQHLQD